ncbi:MAG: uroporphyrinogen-III C-methyltransferase [Myxococcales bacterium]|nr:uroporphyrinogen-III C-methyltransferase [Myxococcales bacterium]
MTDRPPTHVSSADATTPSAGSGVRRPGLVSLVGAGPGDPGLVTRKAELRLRQADVILYDALVSQAVVQLAGPRAELVARRDLLDGRQATINAFLIDRARQGSRVVRLKGGDPFVFGRGAEEAEALARAGIPFEVVPGISAGIAAPAYAGIPVTHRAMASDVTFITGHEDPEKDDSPIEWDRIVRTGGTLVMFMSVRRIEEVVAALTRAGASPRLPAAVIEWGTMPIQRTVDGALEEIVARVRDAGIDHPALFVVGKVVSLRNQIAWFDRRPLFGQRVLVTRAKDQAPPLVEALREVGAGVMMLPVLAFEGPTEPSHLANILDALQKGERVDWAIFTSANGVHAFADALRRRRLDVRVLHGAKIACVGPVTAEAVASLGLIADELPEESRADDLFRVVGGVGGVRGKRFALFRAEVARNVLPDALRDAGGQVDIVPCYRTVLPPVEKDVAKRYVEMSTVVTFTSPSSVMNLCRLLGDDANALLTSKVRACIGPITAQALTERGLPPHVTAKEYTSQGLVDALVDYSAARTPPGSATGDAP